MEPDVLFDVKVTIEPYTVGPMTALERARVGVLRARCRRLALVTETMLREHLEELWQKSA